MTDQSKRAGESRDAGGAPSACLPDFLIVGAAKSGTTSLYHYLSQHKDVFLSPVRKEGRFYSGVGDGSVYWPAFYHFDTAPTLDDYRPLFADHAGEKRTGDVSPDYLAYSHRAAPTVKTVSGPATKIIAILRHPVKRAFSHYLQNVRRDAEFFSFEKTLEIEAERKAAGWGFQWLYTDTGRYAGKLKPYLDTFDQVLVLTQDELAADAAGVMTRLFEFLDIDRMPIRPEGKFNKGGISQDHARILTGLHDHRAGEAMEDIHAELIGDAGAAPSADGVYPPMGSGPALYPDMPAGAKARLEAIFAPEIDALEDLLSRDFSHWRST